MNAAAPARSWTNDDVGTWLDADSAPLGYADAEYGQEDPTGSSTSARSYATLGYADMMAEHSATNAQGHATPEFSPGAVPLAASRVSQQCTGSTFEGGSTGSCDPARRGAASFTLKS